MDEKKYNADGVCIDNTAITETNDSFSELSEARSLLNGQLDYSDQSDATFDFDDVDEKTDFSDDDLLEEVDVIDDDLTEKTDDLTEQASGGEETQVVEADNLQKTTVTVEGDEDDDEHKLDEQYKQAMLANVISKIDLDCTLPTITSSEIGDYAKKAKEYGFGSVCILTSRMKMFKAAAKEQSFCAAVAYPSGEMTEKSKICEIKEAVFNGAKEVDVFFRISALKDEKRRQIIKSLKKYAATIGSKRTFKLSFDSTMVSDEEAQFIVLAAIEAKADYLVVRNCKFSDTRKQLYYAKLCAGKCKLQFADNVNDLSELTKLGDIGVQRFLLSDAIKVADSIRNEIKNQK